MPRLPRSGVRAPRGGHTTASDLVDLVLYVSANSRYTGAAERNCQTLLERFEPHQVKLEVCDLGAHPERAEEDAVCYTPMLVKRRPLPRTYVVGDLSNFDSLVDLLKSCGVNPRR